MWLAASISRMRVIREHSITTAPSSATAPPDSPVPAPRGTKGTPLARQARTARCTSSRLCAKTTALGSAECAVSPSHS
jgi:hypothetical protein